MNPQEYFGEIKQENTAGKIPNPESRQSSKRILRFLLPETEIAHFIGPGGDQVRAIREKYGIHNVHIFPNKNDVIDFDGPGRTDSVRRSMHSCGKRA